MISHRFFPAVRRALAASAVLSTAILASLSPASPVAAVAGSGGTITTYTSGGISYTVHSFLTSDTFTVPTGVTSVDYLIVGGGGGGGGGYIDTAGGSGGGGGQVLTGSATVTPENNYSIVVGTGGTGGLLTLSPSIFGAAGANGTASSAFGQSAGGGYGANAVSDRSYPNPNNGKAGNSGGNLFSGANATPNGYCSRGGGGGGAAENGYVTQMNGSGQTDTSTTGSKGGAGAPSSLRTGTQAYYGGGGGGAGSGNCAQSGTGAGAGGIGGGGNSATYGGQGVSGTCCSGHDATANTGGGGGGQAGYQGKGGDGGTGIVVVRYASPQTVTWSPTTALSTTDSPATPTSAAQSSIGASISYSVVSNTTTTCTVNSTTGVLTFTGAGNCVVRATAASVGAVAAATKDVTFLISRVAQSGLTVTSTSGTVGSPLQVVATGGTGTGSLTYELVSGGTTTCTINAGSLLAGSPGTCLVKVTKAADSSYDSQQTTATVTFVAAPTTTTSTVAVSGPTTTVAVRSSGSTGTGTTDGTNGAATASTVVQPTSTTVAPTTTVAEVATAAPTVAAVDPGAGALEINGETVEATSTRADNALTVSAGGLTVTISAVDGEGTVTPLDADGSVVVKSGDQLKVTATGFATGSEVAVWMFSTPNLLGSVEVGADGSLSRTFAMPEGIESGKHRVALVGKASSGSDARFAVGLVVGTPAKLSTVAKVLIAIPIAGGVLLALLLPTRLRRRRRTA